MKFALCFTLFVSLGVCDAGFFGVVLPRTTSTAQPPAGNIFRNFFNEAETFGKNVITKAFIGNGQFEEKENPRVEEQNNSVAERVKEDEETPSQEPSTSTPEPSTVPPVPDTTLAMPTDAPTSKKSHVPVAEDGGGRTVVEAPVRGCDDGGQRDAKGKCRELF